MSKAEEKAMQYCCTKCANNKLNCGMKLISHGRNCIECSNYIEGYRQAEKEMIDKAIGWIKEINNHHHIMRYSDSCEPPISELTEWFKNYMEEGGEDE